MVHDLLTFKWFRTEGLCALVITSLTTIFLLFLVSSCADQEDGTLSGEDLLHEVSFEVSNNRFQDQNGRQLSSGSIDEVSQVIFTITHGDGIPTEYTNSSIEVYQIDGRMFTENFSLVSGNYKVTSFGLANASNEILFATPIAGSSLAANVTSPLDIDFEVGPGIKNEIAIELVSVSEQRPSDFGLSFFEIDVVETTNFLMSVTALGETDLPPSTLNITFGEHYEYTQELTGGVESIRVRTQSEFDYHIMVTASGYAPYEATLSPAELLSYETEEKTYEVELASQNAEDSFNVFDHVYSFLQTTDGGFVLAGDRDDKGSENGSDALVYKLDSDENIEWLYTYGGTGRDQAYDIVQTSDGGYILVGSSNSLDGDVSENLGGDDIWLCKLDANGLLVWERSYGTSENEVGVSIQRTTDGSFVLAASQSHTSGRSTKVLKLTMTGDIQWAETINELEHWQKIIQTKDGGYVAFGSGKYQNMFLQKLALDGRAEWQKTINLDNFTSRVNALVQTDDGGYILCGGYGHVVKLDAGGELEWNYGSEYRSLQGIVVTSSGDYLIAGGGDSEFFQFKMNQNGQVLSASISHAITPSGYEDIVWAVEKLAGDNVGYLIDRYKIGGIGKIQSVIRVLDSEGNLL